MAEEETPKTKVRDTISEEAASLIEDYAHIFSSEAGKRVLNDLAVRAGRYQTNFVPDSDWTIFNCGQEALFIYIQNQIEKASKLDNEIMGEAENG